MKRQIPEEWLSAYVDGELSSAEQAEVELALQENADYRQRVDDYRQMREQLQRIPRQPLDGDFAARVLRAAERAMITGGEPEAPRAASGNGAHRPVGNATVASAPAGNANTGHAISGSATKANATVDVSQLMQQQSRALRRWRIAFSLSSTLAAILLIVLARNDVLPMGKRMSSAEYVAQSSTNGLSYSAPPPSQEFRESPEDAPVDAQFAADHEAGGMGGLGFGGMGGGGVGGGVGSVPGGVASGGTAPSEIASGGGLPGNGMRGGMGGSAMPGAGGPGGSGQAYRKSEPRDAVTENYSFDDGKGTKAFAEGRADVLPSPSRYLDGRTSGEGRPLAGGLQKSPPDSSSASSPAPVGVAPVPSPKAAPAPQPGALPSKGQPPRLADDSPASGPAHDPAKRSLAVPPGPSRGAAQSAAGAVANAPQPASPSDPNKLGKEPGVGNALDAQGPDSTDGELKQKAQADDGRNRFSEQLQRRQSMRGREFGSEARGEDDTAQNEWHEQHDGLTKELQDIDTKPAPKLLILSVTPPEGVDNIEKLVGVLESDDQDDRLFSGRNRPVDRLLVEKQKTAADESADGKPGSVDQGNVERGGVKRGNVDLVKGEPGQPGDNKVELGKGIASPEARSDKSLERWSVTPDDGRRNNAPDRAIAKFFRGLQNPTYGREGVAASDVASSELASAKKEEAESKRLNSFQQGVDKPTDKPAGDGTDELRTARRLNARRVRTITKDDGTVVEFEPSLELTEPGEVVQLMWFATPKQIDSLYRKLSRDASMHVTARFVKGDSSEAVVPLFNYSRSGGKEPTLYKFVPDENQRWDRKSTGEQLGDVDNFARLPVGTVDEVRGRQRSEAARQEHLKRAATALSDANAAEERPVVQLKLQDGSAQRAKANTSPEAKPEAKLEANTELGELRDDVLIPVLLIVEVTPTLAPASEVEANSDAKTETTPATGTESKPEVPPPAKPEGQGAAPP